MKGKYTWMLVALLLGSLVITQCAPAAETPVASQPPAEEAVTPAAPEEAETIKIGFFSPITGFAAADGTSALNSAQ
jgi:ABC-type transport system substrate-binding protein